MILPVLDPLLAAESHEMVFAYQFLCQSIRLSVHAFFQYYLIIF